MLFFAIIFTIYMTIQRLWFSKRWWNSEGGSDLRNEGVKRVEVNSAESGVLALQPGPEESVRSPELSLAGKGRLE